MSPDPQTIELLQAIDQDLSVLAAAVITLVGVLTIFLARTWHRSPSR